jgi:hypothetical protein
MEPRTVVIDPQIFKRRGVKICGMVLVLLFRWSDPLCAPFFWKKSRPKKFSNFMRFSI